MKQKSFYRTYSRLATFWAATTLTWMGVTAHAAESSNDETTWTPIRHPRLYFYLPTGWDINTTPQAVDLIATSTPTSEDDSFLESFSLDVHDADEFGQTPNKTIEKILAQLESDYPNFTVSNQSKRSHGSHSGTAIEGTFGSSEDVQYIRVFVFSKENSLYVIQELGKDATLDGLRPVFDQIIASMHPFSTVLGQTYYHQYFLIQYPKDWSVKLGLPGTHVAGISEKSKWNDPFIERVSVGSEKLKPGQTFEEYSSQQFDLLLDRLPRANEISRRSPMVGDHQGSSLEFSHRGSGHITYLDVVMVPIRDRVFTLIYSGMNPDFTDMKPTFSLILNSFASPLPPGKVGFQQ